MRRRLALALGVGAFAVAGVGLLRAPSSRSDVDLPVRAPLVPGDADRGRHLLSHVLACGACHGHDLAGAGVDVGMFGMVWAPNLTPAGGPRGTEDWVRALRRGEGPDGRRLLLMPPFRWASLSEAELADLLAALAELRPVDRPAPDDADGPGRWFAGWVDDVPSAVALHPAPAPAPDAAYGAHLANLAGCHDCHGADLAGRTTLLGHAPPVLAEPGAPYAGARFEAGLRQGKGADGRVLSDRMPWRHHAGLSDLEVDALWAHVRERASATGADGLVTDAH